MGIMVTLEPDFHINSGEVGLGSNRNNFQLFTSSFDLFEPFLISLYVFDRFCLKSTKGVMLGCRQNTQTTASITSGLMTLCIGSLHHSKYIRTCNHVVCVRFELRPLTGLCAVLARALVGN